MSRNLFRLQSLLFAALAGVWSVPGFASVVSVDEFSVTRNGTLFFSDGFTDGVEPPSAPNFPSGAPASYAISGTILNTAETGGMLQLDSSLGEITANAAGTGRQETRVRLLTNIDQSDLSLGLKSDDTLSVNGIFSLTTLSGVLNPQYSVRFSDVGPSGVHQTAQMQVLYNTVLGQTQLRYITQNFDTDTITILGTAAFAAPTGADRILLAIDRPNAASNDFFGSFAYVAGGVVGARTTFATASQLFQGENFVRAEFNISDGIAVTPVPEPTSLVFMLIGLTSIGFVCRRQVRSKRV